MRIVNGRYECAYCGAQLDIPLIAEPRVMISAASGKPNVRKLMIDGKVIHTCVIADAARKGDRSTF